MNRTEWGPIGAFLENAWKDEFDGAREEAYAMALEHLNADTVMRAVVALAGNRPLAKHPISAGGTYLPSAQTIAIETAAWDYIGTWQWANGMVHLLVSELREASAHLRGTLAIRNEDMTDSAKHRLAELAGVHGAPYLDKLLAYIDSYGIGYLARHGQGRHYVRDARRRWAQLTLDAAAGGQRIELPR